MSLWGFVVYFVLCFVLGGMKLHSQDELSSKHQFSSRWYLCPWGSLYAFHPISQKFTQCCLWDNSNVGLIDDGPFTSFQDC